MLARHGKCDGAFYLAGYSVELMLKAKVCERMGLPSLFKLDFQASLGTHGIGDLKKFVKTHNLFTLIALSGLKKKFDDKLAKDRKFMEVSSLLFGNWDENARYKPCGFMQPEDVKTLVRQLRGKSGLLSWIKKS